MFLIRSPEVTQVAVATDICCQGLSKRKIIVDKEHFKNSFLNYLGKTLCNLVQLNIRNCEKQLPAKLVTSISPLQ